VIFFTLILAGITKGQQDKSQEDEIEINSVSKLLRDGSDKSAQYNKQATSVFIKEEGLPAFGMLDGTELVKSTMKKYFFLILMHQKKSF